MNWRSVLHLDGKKVPLPSTDGDMPVGTLLLGKLGKEPAEPELQSYSKYPELEWLDEEVEMTEVHHWLGS